MPRRLWNQWGVWGLLGCISLTCLGCAHVISGGLREQAEPPLAFAQLRANPEAYKDRTVILGGDILQTDNLREGTRMEVLQKPLDRTEVPQITDDTGGRFMALCRDYLDPAVYAKGRRITVAGRVLGSYTGKIGEVDYVYPLIECIETHLFPSAMVALQRSNAYPWWAWPPYGPTWYRWGPHYGAWGPWYGFW